MKVFIFLITTFLLAQSASLLSSKALTAYSQNQQDHTYYNITFQVSSPIPQHAAIHVVLPKEYEFQSVIAHDFGCFQKLNLDYLSIDCAYTFNEQVTISMVPLDGIFYNKTNVWIGKLILAEYVFIFGKIENPKKIAQSGYFSVSTYYQDSVVEKNTQFGRMKFVEPINNNWLGEGKVTNLGSTDIGEGSSWRFEFSAIEELNSGNDYRFIFPKGFWSNKAMCKWSNYIGQQSQGMILHDKRSIVCKKIDMKVTGKQQVEIIGMMNPQYSGTFNAFEIEVMNGQSQQVLTKLEIADTVEIAPGTLNVTFVQNIKYRSGSQKHTFYVNVVNEVREGVIEMSYEGEWQAGESECLLVQGFDESSKCRMDGDNRVRVYDFGSIDRNQRLVVELSGMVSPEEVGAYLIHIETKTKESQVVDQNDITVLINETYGYIKRFKVHTISRPEKLQADSSGPLEILLFLKHTLPKTDLFTQGLIDIEVYPQIEYPDQSKYGVLKCYFYDRIPATSCSFDNTFPNRTIIQLNTPQNYDFKESEIPITITTQGATHPYHEGIKLPKLVQRYIFQVHFYSIDISQPTNPQTTLTEVYFSEFVLDPLPIEDPYITFLPSSTSKNTNVIFKFLYTAQIDLINNFKDPVNKDYIIRVIFNDGFASNLGYEKDRKYIEYPCMVTYQPTDATQEVKCDLDTRDIETITPSPHIDIYGIDLSQNEQILITLPNIRTGDGDEASLKFEVLEETDGYLDPYVIVYEREFKFDLITPDENVNNLAPTTIPDSDINHPNIEYTFTVADPMVDQPDYITLELPYQDIPDLVQYPEAVDKVYKIPTQTYVTPISTNVADEHTLDDPVRQKVFDDVAQSSPYVIKALLDNPPYADTFPFDITLHKANQPPRKHRTHVTIPPSDLESTQFQLLDPVPYKNTEHEFQIDFTNHNPMIDDFEIEMVFENVQTQQSDHFYCFTNLTPLTDLPIDCKATDQTTIKITNLQAIPASTSIQVKVRLLTPDSTPVTPEVDIRLYYHKDFPKTVDQAIDLQCPQISPSVQSFIHFEIEQPLLTANPGYHNKNYIGPIRLNFETADPFTNIRVTMEDFKANGPLECSLDGTFIQCEEIEDEGDLIVNVPDVAGTPNQGHELIVTVEGNLVPGVEYPADSGFYEVKMNLDDLQEGNTLVEIGGNRLDEFNVDIGTRTENSENMFTFRFSGKGEQVPSFSSGGRLYLIFPQMDKHQTRIFQRDLGFSNKKDGSYVGCWFKPGAGYLIAETGKDLKCRLMKPMVDEVGVRVEIINFETLPELGFKGEVRVVNIKNPAYPRESAELGILIETQGGPKHFQGEYTLHMHIDNSPARAPFNVGYASTGNSLSFESGKKVGDSPVKLEQYMQYDEDMPAGSFFKSNVPVDLEVVRQPALNCDLSKYVECYVFKEDNVVVFELKTAVSANDEQYAPIDLLTLPDGALDSASQMRSEVWIGKVTKGEVTHDLSAEKWEELEGAITTASVGIDANFVPGEDNDIEVAFTVPSKIPKGGRIEIKAPAEKLKTHCKNVVTKGSDLKNADGGSQLVCKVKNDNTWVITGFDELPAGSEIKIAGKAKLHTSAPANNNFELETFSSEDPNERSRIDKKTDLGGFSYPSRQMVRMDDSNIYPYIEHKLIRKGSQSPLRFIVTSDQSISQVTVKLPKPAFTYDPTFKYIAYLKEIDDYRKTLGSKVSITEDPSFIYFDIRVLAHIQPNAVLVMSLQKFKYQRFDNPATEGLYPIDLTVDGRPQTHFVEVYGHDFTQCVFKSYVTQPGAPNVVDLLVQPNTLIPSSHHLIIEFAIAYFQTEDLGTNLPSNQAIPIDIIDSDVVAAMDCKLLHGSIPANQPAKIYCTSFTNDIAPSNYLRFAFSLTNPTLSSPAFIPVLVYSFDPLNHVKSNFNYLLDSYFISEAITPISASTVYSPTSYEYLMQNEDFGFQSKHINPLTMLDALLVIIPYEITHQTGIIANGCHFGSAPNQGDLIVLKELRSVICIPDSNNLNGGDQVTLKGVFNSGMKAMNVQSLVTHACYLSSRPSESVEVSYTNFLTQNMVSSMASGFSVSEMYNIRETYQPSDYEFSITSTRWDLVKEVTIEIPASKFTLESEMCQSGGQSEIEIERCWIDSTNERIVISVKATADQSEKVLIIQSQYSAFLVDDEAITQIDPAGFSARLFSDSGCDYSNDDCVIASRNGDNSVLSYTSSTVRQVDEFEHEVMRYYDGEVLNDAVTDYELVVRFEVEAKVAMSAITTQNDDHIIKVNNLLTCTGVLVCTVQQLDRYCLSSGSQVHIFFRDEILANAVLDVSYQCAGQLADTTTYLTKLHGSIQDTRAGDQYYFQTEQAIVKMLNDNLYLSNLDTHYLTKISQQLNLLQLDFTYDSLPTAVDQIVLQFDKLDLFDYKTVFADGQFANVVSGQQYACNADCYFIETQNTYKIVISRPDVNSQTDHLELLINNPSDDNQLSFQLYGLSTQNNLVYFYRQVSNLFDLTITTGLTQPTESLLTIDKPIGSPAITFTITTALVLDANSYSILQLDAAYDCQQDTIKLPDKQYLILKHTSQVTSTFQTQLTCDHLSSLVVYNYKSDSELELRTTTLSASNGILTPTNQISLTSFELFSHQPSAESYAKFKLDITNLKTELLSYSYTIDSDDQLQFTFGSTYHLASSTECYVLSGVTNSDQRKAIACSVTSSTVVISNFDGLSGELVVLIKGTNKSSISGSNTLDVDYYSNSQSQSDGLPVYHLQLSYTNEVFSSSAYTNTLVRLAQVDYDSTDTHLDIGITPSSTISSSGTVTITVRLDKDIQLTSNTCSCVIAPSFSVTCQVVNAQEIQLTAVNMFSIAGSDWSGEQVFEVTISNQAIDNSKYLYYVSVQIDSAELSEQVVAYGSNDSVFTGQLTSISHTPSTTTELHVQLNGLQMALDSSSNGIIVSMVGSNWPAMTSGPCESLCYVNSALASSACQKEPGYVVVLVDASVGDNVDCYLPQVELPTSNADAWDLSVSLTNGNYITRVPAVASRVQQQFTISNTGTLDGSANAVNIVDTQSFYTARQTAESKAYQIEIQTGTISHGVYIYIDYGYIGPVLTSDVCDTFAQCRIYSQKIVVLFKSGSQSGYQRVPAAPLTLSSIDALTLSQSSVHYAIYQLTTGNAYLSKTNTYAFADIQLPSFTLTHSSSNLDANLHSFNTLRFDIPSAIPINTLTHLDVSIPQAHVPLAKVHQACHSNQHNCQYSDSNSLNHYYVNPTSASITLHYSLINPNNDYTITIDIYSNHKLYAQSTHTVAIIQHTHFCNTRPLQPLYYKKYSIQAPIHFTFKTTLAITDSDTITIQSDVLSSVTSSIQCRVQHKQYFASFPCSLSSNQITISKSPVYSYFQQNQPYHIAIYSNLPSIANNYHIFTFSINNQQKNVYAYHGQSDNRQLQVISYQYSNRQAAQSTFFFAQIQLNNLPSSSLQIFLSNISPTALVNCKSQYSSCQIFSHQSGSIIQIDSITTQNTLTIHVDSLMLPNSQFENITPLFTQISKDHTYYYRIQTLQYIDGYNSIPASTSLSNSMDALANTQFYATNTQWQVSNILITSIDGVITLDFHSSSISEQLDQFTYQINSIICTPIYINTQTGFIAFNSISFTGSQINLKIQSNIQNPSKYSTIYGSNPTTTLTTYSNGLKTFESTITLPAFSSFTYDTTAYNIGTMSVSSLALQGKNNVINFSLTTILTTLRQLDEWVLEFDNGIENCQTCLFNNVPCRISDVGLHVYNWQNQPWEVQAICQTSSSNIQITNKIKIKGMDEEVQSSFTYVITTWDSSQLGNVVQVNNQVFPNLYFSATRHLRKNSQNPDRTQFLLSLPDLTYSSSNNEYFTIEVPNNSFQSTDNSYYCLFYNEQIKYRVYDSPIYAACDLSSDIITVQCPISGLAGSTYLLSFETFSSLATQLPPHQTNKPFKVAVYKPPGTVSFAGMLKVPFIADFDEAEVEHFSLTGGELDNMILRFKVPENMAVSGADSEIQVRIRFDAEAYEADLGLDETYRKVGYEKGKKSGKKHAHAGMCASCQLIPVFGEDGEEPMLTLTELAELNEGEEYELIIPTIKSKGGGEKASSFVLEIIELRAGESEEIVMFRKDFSNHETLKSNAPDKEMSVKMKSDKKDIEGDMKLSIEIDSEEEMDPNSNDGIMVIVDKNSKKNFKKKKECPGSCPQSESSSSGKSSESDHGFEDFGDVDADNDGTADWEVMTFKDLPVVVFKPKSNNGLHKGKKELTFGDSFETGPYQDTLKIKEIVVSKKGETAQKKDDQDAGADDELDLELEYLTSFDDASLARTKGSPNVGNDNVYEFSFTCPKPIMASYIDSDEYSQIIITTPPELTPISDECQLGSGFVGITDSENVDLRCVRSDPDKYLIQGYQQVPAATPLHVRFQLANQHPPTDHISVPKVKIEAIVDGTPHMIAEVGDLGSVDTRADLAPLTQLEETSDWEDYVYAKEWGPLQFSYKARTPEDVAPTDKLVVTLDGDWTLASGTEVMIDSANKEDGGEWEEVDRSSAGPVHTFTPQVAIPADTDNKLQLKSNLGDDDHNGLKRPDSPDLYNLLLEEKDSGDNLLLRRVDEFLVEPRPSEDLTVDVLNKVRAKESPFLFHFTPDVPLLVNDQIHFEFATNLKSSQYPMFQPHLGDVITCREHLTDHVLSDDPLDCVVQPGDQLTGKPSIVKIQLKKNVNSGVPVKVWITGVVQPNTKWAVIKLKAKRSCRNDNYQCPVYQTTMAYKTIQQDPNNPIVPDDQDKITFTAQGQIGDTNKKHKTSIFMQSGFNHISQNDWIILSYPKDNIRMNDVCTLSNGICMAFPGSNVVIMKSNVDLTTTVPETPIDIEIDSMNNGWYRRGQEYNLKIVNEDGELRKEFEFSYSYEYLESSNTDIKVINTQTHNYDENTGDERNYFLRDYMNLMQFEIKKVWVNEDIKQFYLQIPQEIEFLDKKYCNSTLAISNNNRSPYPLRFECIINEDNRVELNMLDEFPAYASYGNLYDIRLYLKGFINVNPFGDGRKGGVSSNFELYGTNGNGGYSRNGINRFEFSIEISPYDQPDLNYVTFNTKSFYERKARIEQKDVEFYMLYEPTTEVEVNKLDLLVFTIPDEYRFPQIEDLDDCELIGKQVEEARSCKLLRQDGKTYIRMGLPDNYDHHVRIIRLSSTVDLFDAPSIPGSHYTVELGGFEEPLLYEKQTEPINSVYGPTLPLDSISIDYTHDSELPGLFEFTFRNGDFELNEGYDKDDNQRYTQIDLIFDHTSGYKYDLGLKTPQVGCIPLEGLATTLKDSLKCRVHVSGGISDPPSISVSDYEPVEPNTQVKLWVYGILTLKPGQNAPIKVGVKQYYKDIPTASYLYEPISFLPLSPATPLDQQSNPHPTSVVVDPSSSSRVYGHSSYTFTFTPNVAIDSDDKLFLQFPSHYFGDPNSPQNTQPTCASRCAHVYPIPLSNLLILTFDPPVTPAETSFTIANLPNPSYARTDPITIQAYSQVDKKRKEEFRFDLDREIHVCTDLFSDSLLLLTDQNQGMNQVDYTIDLTFNHQILYGLLINTNCILDHDKTNLTLTNEDDPTQDLSPITYQFYGSNIDVQLNGIVLSNMKYRIQMDWIQNPGDQVEISVESYFETVNQIQCSQDLEAPTLKAVQVYDCLLQLDSQFKNVDIRSVYTFKVSCETPIRQDSELILTLPDQFVEANPETELRCSSQDPDTLSSAWCVREDKEVVVPLRNKKANEEFQVSFTLQNPSMAKDDYRFSSKVGINGITYARSSQDAIVPILPSPTQSSDDCLLTVYPSTIGMKAIYLFEFPTVPDGVSRAILTFPSDYVSELPQHCSFNPIERDWISLLKQNDPIPCTNDADWELHFDMTDFTGNHLVVKQLHNPSLTQPQSLVLLKLLTPTQELVQTYTYLVPEFSQQPQTLTLDSLDLDEKRPNLKSNYDFGITLPDLFPDQQPLTLIIDIPPLYDPMLDTLQPTCQNCQIIANHIILQDYPFTHLQNKITIGDMINPELDLCGEDSLFQVSLVSIPHNVGLAQSSNDAICPQIDMSFVPYFITVEGPLQMKPGVSNPLQVQLQEPASYLSLTPSSDENGITFEPENIVFQDFESPNQDFSVKIGSDVPAGTYAINFKKEEQEKPELYEAVSTVKIEVVPLDDSNTPLIKVEPFSQTTVGQPLQVKVSTDELPDNPVRFTVTTDQPEDEVRVGLYADYGEYAKSDKEVSKLSCDKEILTKKEDTFLVRVQTDKVIDPIKLTFSISSSYPMVHKLERHFMYLNFDVGSYSSNNINQAPPLRIELSPSIVLSANVNEKVFTTEDSITVLSPKILGLTKEKMQANSGRIRVLATDEALAYYVLELDKSSSGMNQDTLMEQVVTTEGQQFGQVEVKRVMEEKQILNRGYIDLSFLDAQTNYRLFVMLFSPLGNSEIKSLRFKTALSQPGTLVRVPCLWVPQPEDVLRALSLTLKVPEERLVITKTNPEDLQNYTPIDPNDVVQFSNPQIFLDVLIIPDAQKDEPSPSQLVLKYLDSKDIMKSLLPPFDNHSNNLAVHYSIPSFPVLPDQANVINQTFYSFQIQFQLFAPEAVIYSTLNPRGAQKDVPLSNQIITGLTREGNQAYMWQRSKSDHNGFINIRYDRLDSNYQEWDLYMILGLETVYSIEIYDEESNVKLYQINLPKNPNLIQNQQERLALLKEKNAELAEAIEEAENEQN